MRKEDIKYQIELKKYKFELEYQRDFRIIVFASSTLFVIVLKILLEENIGSYRFKLMLATLVVLAVIIISLVFVYIYARSKFLRQINSLFKKYIEYDE